MYPKHTNTKTNEMYQHQYETLNPTTKIVIVKVR